jgi:hypothetical protein
METKRLTALSQATLATVNPIWTIDLLQYAVARTTRKRFPHKKRHPEGAVFVAGHAGYIGGTTITCHPMMLLRMRRLLLVFHCLQFGGYVGVLRLQQCLVLFYPHCSFSCESSGRPGQYRRDQAVDNNFSDCTGRRACQDRRV